MKEEEKTYFRKTEWATEIWKSAVVSFATSMRLFSRWITRQVALQATQPTSMGNEHFLPKLQAVFPKKYRFALQNVSFKSISSQNPEVIKTLMQLKGKNSHLRISSPQGINSDFRVEHTINPILLKPKGSSIGFERF